MGKDRRRRRIRRRATMFITTLTPRSWDLLGYAILAAGAIAALIAR